MNINPSDKKSDRELLEKIVIREWVEDNIKKITERENKPTKSN